MSPPFGPKDARSRRGGATHKQTCLPIYGQLWALMVSYLSALTILSKYFILNRKGLSIYQISPLSHYTSLLNHSLVQELSLQGGCTSYGLPITCMGYANIVTAHMTLRTQYIVVVLMCYLLYIHVGITIQQSPQNGSYKLYHSAVCDVRVPI